MNKTAPPLVTFGLRSHEKIEFFKHMPQEPLDSYLYAAALQTSLPFPGPGKPNSKTITVLVAHYTPNGWTWLYPDAITKQLIGNQLKNGRAILDRWYYFHIDEKRPYQ